MIIDRHFRGPPDSAQGGYACGLLAERIAGPSASVSLRRPPPLERALQIAERDDGSAALLDGDLVLAEGERAELRLDLPEPVSADVARRAAEAWPWRDRHPFPGCFGCGPERSQDEAVAISTGPVDGGDVFAGPWTPLAAFAPGGEGPIAARFAWAALDCPTAGPAVPLDAAPSVLARLTATVVAPIVAGRTHTVTAWLIGHDGRKHRGGAAIHGPDGELCAYSEGLWIELRDPSSMGART